MMLVRILGLASEDEHDPKGEERRGVAGSPRSDENAGYIKTDLSDLKVH
jgi:hypothetical protein